jgi:D-alanine-D-alanine ligase
MHSKLSFPITHGPNGEDGTLQGIFLQLDIPFVGPGVLGSAVAMDKDFTKRILRDAGIGHAKGITFYKHEIEKISYAETTNELRYYFICETVQYGFICWCKPSHY